MGRFSYAAPLLVLLVACGSSGDPGIGGGAVVNFSITKSGAPVPCSEVADLITRIDGIVKNDNGTQALKAEADCASGEFVLTGITSGSYKVQLTAKGDLGGEADATLFTSSTDITLPADDGIGVSLRPEVAFLDLSWLFGAEALMPCADQIASVAVTIGTGNSQGGNFSKEYGCQETPISIARPFALTEHTIKLEAYNHQGFIDYSTDEIRLFERGSNEYAATLTPIGGVLLLDWVFKRGDDMSEACDGSTVGVTDVVATVVGTEGGATTSERIDCTAARPYVYRARRYSQGRNLELTLEGTGDAYFVARRAVRMPAGDYAAGALVMEAVGTATVSIEVQTSTCTSNQVERFDVSVFEIPTRSGERLVFEGTIGVTEDHIAVPELPYGTYRVEVVEQGPNQAICAVDELRLIDARESTWDPFIF